MTFSPIRRTRPARIAALLACMAVIGSAAQAAPAVDRPATPRIDARQQQQQARIQHGLANGALTLREARQLQRQQRAITRAEHLAKADGVVTAAERARLTQMQDQAGRDIRRELHDPSHDRPHDPRQLSGGGRG